MEWRKHRNSFQPTLPQSLLITIYSLLFPPLSGHSPQHADILLLHRHLKGDGVLDESHDRCCTRPHWAGQKVSNQHALLYAWRSFDPFSASFYSKFFPVKIITSLCQGVFASWERKYRNIKTLMFTWMTDWTGDATMKLWQKGTEQTGLLKESNNFQCLKQELDSLDCLFDLKLIEKCNSFYSQSTLQLQSIL